MTTHPVNLDLHLSQAQIGAIQANPDIGHIVDAPFPGAPLVVAFGFVSWNAPPIFDFAGRLHKFEALSGKPVNRILVRDPANLWYHHGVPGLGHNVHSVAIALGRLIAQMKPASVTTLGQSMGGYAAVVFGALLNVDQILAFGPMSYFRSDWARRDGDSRWLGAMETLDRFPPPQRYDDLPALLASAPRLPKVDLVFGTGAEADPKEINRDALHAARFGAVPGVDIHTIPESGHAVVEWLIKRKRIDNVIANWLLPTSPDPAIKRGVPDLAAPGKPAFRTFDDTWRTWIGERLIGKASSEQLMQALTRQGFHPGEAQHEIYKAFRSPYLQSAARVACPDTDGHNTK
jgi:hypothetical protein